jgi:hypothetical protein
MSNNNSPKYDSFGFIINNENDSKLTSNNDWNLWLKIFGWTFLILLIISKIISMIIAGFISYHANLLELNILKKIFFMSIAIIYSHLYLIYKIVSYFLNTYLITGMS